ncbi:unnamed protein product [Adineta steineri]|uniref:Uncharacterized protein n=1 Tax=Adineta steineri TaxID=433720 RepID=A0A814DDT4_9BILA|nr:unnamed protein product [Adineta steineri]CAF4039213.1 unnamed protein product [Adineta steineri]
MDDVTRSAHVLVNTESIINDTISSAIAINDDEAEALPLQYMKKEKNTTNHVKDDINNSNVKERQGQLPITLMDVNKKVLAPTHNNQDIDKVKSVVENDKKNKKYGETSELYGESDEDQKGLHNMKHSQEEEVDEDINENDN